MMSEMWKGPAYEYGYTWGPWAWMYQFKNQRPLFFPFDEKKDWAEGHPDWTETALFVAPPKTAIVKLEAERDALASRGEKLSRAAYDYASNYLLDERDDPELCNLFPNQHERIVALFDAIEDFDALPTHTPAGN